MKDESVLVRVGMGLSGMESAAWMPGQYREFQKSGHSGIARRIGVKGVPGPHNFLEYVKGFRVDGEEQLHWMRGSMKDSYRIDKWWYNRLVQTKDTEGGVTNVSYSPLLLSWVYTSYKTCIMLEWCYVMEV